MWSPDVYQGSPSPVTGFMAAVAKAGAFAALLRVFVSSFGTVRTDWQPIIWGLAILSLVVGAVVALLQKDVKRMMAYSSINHVGFILLGVEAATTRGVSAALYYLFTYMFLTIGAFAVITVMARDGRHRPPDHRLPRTGPTAADAGAGLRRPAPGPGRRALHHRIPGQIRGGRGGRWPPTATCWPPWPWPPPPSPPSSICGWPWPCTRRSGRWPTRWTWTTSPRPA